jgi:hypothetical protein
MSTEPENSTECLFISPIPATEPKAAHSEAHDFRNAIKVEVYDYLAAHEK